MPYPNVGARFYGHGHGSSSFGSVVPPAPFSLEEASRGADVLDLDEPLEVHVWFQLPDRLMRRSDAQASRMTRDALWVEAGRGERKLVPWVWRSSVKHRA